VRWAAPVERDQRTFGNVQPLEDVTPAE